MAGEITFDLDQESDLIAFCKDADILIWDGMYTDAEIVNKNGWGHSTIEQAIYFTKKSGVKKTVICHHSPTRNDEDIDALGASLPKKYVEFGLEGAKFNL